VHYDLVTNLERSILDAQSCDIPFSKEWEFLVDTYKIATHRDPIMSYVEGTMPQVSLEDVVSTFRTLQEQHA